MYTKKNISISSPTQKLRKVVFSGSEENLKKINYQSQKRPICFTLLCRGVFMFYMLKSCEKNLKSLFILLKNNQQKKSLQNPKGSG